MSWLEDICMLHLFRTELCGSLFSKALKDSILGYLAVKLFLLKKNKIRKMVLIL